MIRDLLEGFKYANHLWPILILRLYVGFYFLSSAVAKKTSDYALSPNLSAYIDQNLFSHDPPAWLSIFFTNFVQPYWQIISSLQVSFEYMLGFFFVIGFLNRPAALLAMVYIYFVSYISPVEQVSFFVQLNFIIASLLVFGSGRAAGFDYFFYKRQRGLVW